EIRSGADFHSQVDRLTRGLESMLARSSTSSKQAPETRSLALQPPGSEVRASQMRRLTVLQCGCDVFEADAILTALDPEEQHDLLLEFQQLCRDVTVQFAGTVVKTTDHGILVCFGVPVALECAARRAVRAGLTLLDQMAALNERLGQRHPDLHLSA